MKSFLLFCEDVVATKRKGITHLQQMKPIEFVEFMLKVGKKMKGILSSVPVSLKVDGLGCRFGRDVEGRFFFESSHSGPVFSEKRFISYHKEHGDPANTGAAGRAEHFDDMFDALKASDLWKDLPYDVKVICEVLYNPLAQEGDGTLTFATVKYDTEKLGNLMTIVPMAVLIASTGAPKANQKKIIDSLVAKSTSEIKVITSKLSMKPIDIRGFVDPIKSLDKDALTILSSRLGKDQEKKREIIEIIDRVKHEMADYLLHHPNILNRDILGNEIEGLVFNFDDQNIKVTTPEFKQKLAVKLANRGK